jgi:trans-2,3-dihydro-3-hydroxyanthranilate isomerase
MREYEYLTLDVFTEQRFGGNPLAVFPHAEGLSDDDMQAIAREFNYAETTFVLPPTDPANTARVRIFNPVAEMPFAGHPNVGTGFALARRGGGDSLRFEEPAGIVTVQIDRGPDGAVRGATISAPRSLQQGIAVPSEHVAACAGLSQDDLETTLHEPLVAGVGTDFIFAELNTVTALQAATPDVAAFRDLADDMPELAPHPKLYLYVRTAPEQVQARMFAPLVGVPEDPATGSAAAALAALLVSFAPGDDVALAFEIAQGTEMGRPSRLLATAVKTGEGPVEATVGGACVPVMHGTITL